MTRHAPLFVLLVSLAGMTVAGSPARKPIAPKAVHVCVQLDGAEDRWTFMTHEATTPVPGMALRKGIEKALWYSGKKFNGCSVVGCEGCYVCVPR